MLKTLGRETKGFRLVSILTPICMIGEVIMEMIIPKLMATIVDDGVTAGNMDVIYSVGAKMLVAALIGLLVGILGAMFGSHAATGFARNLRRGMFRNIQTFSFANIDKYSTAGLVTRMTTDVTNIQNAYQMLLRMAIRAPASMIVALVMSFTINAELASVYLVAVILLGCALMFIMTRATRYFTGAFRKYDDLNESVQENVSAIRVVKAYVREKFEGEKFRKASENVRQLLMRAELILSWNAPLMTLSVYSCILIISWLGARLIVLSGATSFTTGDLMSMLSYCMNILMSLMMLSMVFVMITMSAASAKRVAEVLDEKSDLANGENPVMEVKDGSVKFNNVSFAYKKDGEKALENINLDIKSGETIGIIGGTGSAKSSLVQLLPRLYDVTEGSVEVGGVDVRKYDLETLRNSVAMVLQKNELFSGTIAENLRWGNPNATDAEIEDACKQACADEFIERFPDRYETYIEQGGSNVSGGQKQRLCIARALLKKPKILILDDSTSAVDTATDAKIRHSFAEKIPGTTVFIIAQRVSSVENADHVLVLDNGHISGYDTPENLLKTNAIYQEVYNSQTKGSGDFDEKGGEA
ncbi:MAG: ABC transporter ATP-binding protein [Gemmiger sp.]|uniref:ABC transporter ATP-binding protein/permease n=1 Tax=Subdoligranulum variabile TaxID=214851 RepID=A0A921LS42_9FIRM|nr:MULTISPECIES: ABC transporter ATP-binding protein [Gemmiger]MBM6899091.1 ABC transporter ATP-binding protein [Gemmiger formicilis]MEE0709860.1 ABC transporter ATP-binding protein [Gemmiger sp.]HJG29713.1 ABC transporter ATP-binding protein/permease [Subdoligranulum variabile]